MAIRDYGDFESWIKFFLTGIVYVAEEAVETSHKIINLQKEVSTRIYRAYRKPSKIALLYDELFNRPIVSIKDIGKIVNVTFPTAEEMCMKLVKLGILKEITGKTRNRMFVYKDYLDILKKE